MHRLFLKSLQCLYCLYYLFFFSYGSQWFCLTGSKASHVISGLATQEMSLKCVYVYLLNLYASGVCRL